MRKGNLSRTMLAAGILGLALGACGNEDSTGTGSGGTTTSGQGSGGTPSTGGTASGGTSGSGGTTAQPETGGTSGSGGTTESGGSKASGGTRGTGGVGSGGTSTSASGGSSTQGTGGAVGTGGGNAGGRTGATGGARMGGRTGAGGRTTSSTGGTTGGGATGAGGKGTGGTSGGRGGSTGNETCTPSKAASQTVSGSGPHKVVIETNSDPGIKCGTIFRPADLGGDEKYPIFVWGEGGCSQNGLSNQAAMGEIASWGYFIVADGTPGGTDSCEGGQDGAAFLDYITWAIAENGKCCSAYYQSLDTTEIAADGFSCGGLMAENVSGDPRFTAIGITSSGMFGGNAAIYDGIHTPFKIMNGGPDDMAYENGLNDYDEISSRGIPIIYFSKTSAGHGGDLFQARGDFNLVNLAWLNWQLKGDEGATGKGFLHGSTCEFCTASGWEYMSANIQ
jgi:hypothetical protein